VVGARGKRLVVGLVVEQGDAGRRGAGAPAAVRDLVADAASEGREVVPATKKAGAGEDANVHVLDDVLGLVLGGGEDDGERVETVELIACASRVEAARREVDAIGIALLPDGGLREGCGETRHATSLSDAGLDAIPGIREPLLVRVFERPL